MSHDEHKEHHGMVMETSNLEIMPTEFDSVLGSVENYRELIKLAHN